MTQSEILTNLCGFSATFHEVNREHPEQRGTCHASRQAKMLGEFQALALVIRADCLTIDRRRRVGQALEHQPSHDLTMFQDEGHLARANLKNCPRGRRLARLEAEA